MNGRQIGSLIVDTLQEGIGVDASAFYLKCYITKISINAWKKVPQMDRTGYLLVNSVAWNTIKKDSDLSEYIEVRYSSDKKVIGKYHDADVMVLLGQDLPDDKPIIRFVQPTSS